MHTSPRSRFQSFEDVVSKNISPAVIHEMVKNIVPKSVKQELEKEHAKVIKEIVAQEKAKSSERDDQQGPAPSNSTKPTPIVDEATSSTAKTEEGHAEDTSEAEEEETEGASETGSVILHDVVGDESEDNESIKSVVV